jgi:hypothetical protein
MIVLEIAGQWSELVISDMLPSIKFKSNFNDIEFPTAKEV